MYEYVDLLCYLFFLASLIYGVIGSTEGDGYHSDVWLWMGVSGVVGYSVVLETLAHLLGVLQRLCGMHLKPIPVPVDEGGLPIVYSDRYNITACGIEKVHPFDSVKYRRVVQHLIDLGTIPSAKALVSSDLCPRYLLQEVHSFLYLLSLNYAICVSRVVEVPVCIVPAPLLRHRVLVPMLYGTYGSLLAASISLTKGWAVNLSGGYHHASGRNGGGGFCVYADITMVVKFMRLWYPHKVRRVAIIDVDAHQGNGHERDFLRDEDVFIMDFYNPHIYPGDELAKHAIRYTEHISAYTSDSVYCSALSTALEQMYRLFQPDFIVYNAGTDCMEGDPLGGLSLTESGIVRRDQVVFESAMQRKVPIVMLLSGGYQLSNAPAIAASISNLITFLHK